MDANPLALLAVFAGSLLASTLLVPIAGMCGRRLGFVDRPRRGEVQEFILPRSGGYGIFLAFAIGVAISLVLLPRYTDEYPRLWGLLLGSALLVPLAILDDWKRLPPTPQLFWQIAAAGVPILFGVTFDNLAGPFGSIVPLPGFLVLPATLLWIVGMVNTVNLTDTMDGLAGGVATIAALVLAGVSLQNGQTSIAALSLALAGATIGFLFYNFHPSRIIMGSSGSLFLGYALGVLAIIGGAKIAAAVMVLGLPILDVAYVIISRLRRGRSPLRGGDAAHLPHRLLALGLSQHQVALVLYGVCLLFGLLALVLTKVEKLYGFLLLGLVALALIWFAARRQDEATIAHGSAPRDERP